MALTIIFITLMGLSFLWLILDRTYHWDTDVESTVFCILFSLVFLINCTALISCRLNTKAQVYEFESARKTIQQQRVNKISEYERATLTKEIVDKNQWLAKEQFWAKSIWLNWYYDKSIIYVKPIE